MALQTPIALLVLLLVFVVPVLSIYRGRRHADGLDWPRVRLGLAVNAGIVLGVIALVVATGSRSATGLVVPSVDAIIDGSLFGFIAFGGVMLLVGLLAKFRGGVAADPASLVVFEQPLYRRLAVAVTGATIESLLFYGVAIGAVLALGGGQYVAGGVAAAGLVLVRARFSTANAVQWVPGAFVLSGVALLADTVIPVLLIRLLYDTLTLASGDAEEYVSTEGTA